MKLFKHPALVLLVLLTVQYNFLNAKPTSGFYLPEPIRQVTMRYMSINNLIVLPLVINDNITVNLVLDTGTRNIVLFGKRFQNLFQFVPQKRIQFSGMGSGNPVFGQLSLNNKVELTSLIGENMPLVVVNNKNVFISSPKIDGIIGYDIFQKFEVEINPRERLITFRSPLNNLNPNGFTHIPLRIEKTMPVLDSKISLSENSSLLTNLMIDTGSQLGVLIKTTNEELLSSGLSVILGVGMSGNIQGIKTMAEHVELDGMSFYDQPAGIILSEWHNYGSIGMDILKDYVIIINYIGAYARLKKL